MAIASGVRIRKNAKGKTTHIAIDIRRHPQAIEALQEAGIIQKTPFEKRCENALTIEEVRQSMHQLITDFYAQRSH